MVLVFTGRASKHLRGVLYEASRPRVTHFCDAPTRGVLGRRFAESTNTRFKDLIKAPRLVELVLPQVQAACDLSLPTPWY